MQDRAVRNVLLVTPFPLAAVGGVSTAVRMLYRELREAGHQASVLVPGDQTYIVPNGDPEVPTHSAYFRTPFVKDAPFRGLVAFCILFPVTLYLLARFLRDKNVDIVVAQYPAPWLLYFAVLRPFGRWKLVLTFQGNDAHDLPLMPWIDRAIVRALLAAADRVVGVSQTLLNEVQAIFPRLRLSGVVVPNGTPVHDATAAPPAGCLELPSDFVSTAGHLISRKGIDLIIRALRLLRDRDIRLTLVVAGDGPERDNLVRLARDLDVHDSVIFVGNQSHEAVLDLMKRSMVFVLASRAEGLPLVVLEAMAHAVPVIATRIDGIPELIEDGMNGLVVPPEDTSSLADALERLHGDSTLRRRIGAAGRERVLRDYTWAVVAQRYIDIFEQLLGHDLPQRGAGVTAVTSVRIQPRKDAEAPKTLAPDDPDLGVEPVRLPAAMRPMLCVVVDTEEEFDWGAPFSRANVSVRAIRKLDRLQRLLERFRVVPTYVVDYPVASQADGYAPLNEFVDSGCCRLGAHLHPWVNPPFDEDLNHRNSYACNLPAWLEREKLRRLLDEIEAHTGVRARTYKAGRYGFGRSTLRALQDLGVDVDVSINPQMDFSADGGPSFTAFSAEPFYFGRGRPVLEVPCTGGYAGLAAANGRLLHGIASRPGLRRLHLVGVLARTSLVNKIRLSPEGHPFSELRQLTSALLARGVRTFSLTFHSPSMEPGNTPYVRTAADLEAFMKCIESYLEFFFGTLGGVSTTPEELKALIERRSDDRLAREIVAQGATS